MPATLRTAAACAIAHHGELLQGMFLDEGHQRVPGLVTLPYEALLSIVDVTVVDEGEHRVEPEDCTKSLRAATLALAERGAAGSRARVRVRSNIPQRLGMGSSTADVVATIRAIGRALEAPFAAETVARLAVEAELASDATMFHEPVLFGHRSGDVLQPLGARYPAMVIVGCNPAPPGSGVETTALPLAEHDHSTLLRFDTLRERLVGAFTDGDVATLGAIATESAAINQRHLPNAAFEPLVELCENIGACGVQVAHSGTLAGVIVDPEHAAATRQVMEAERFMAEQGWPRWAFSLPRRSVIGAGASPAIAIERAPGR